LFFPLYYWGFGSLWRSSLLQAQAGWVRSLLGDPFGIVSIRIAISTLSVINPILLFAFLRGRQKRGTGYGLPA
jgi:hypothetical protein